MPQLFFISNESITATDTPAYTGGRPVKVETGLGRLLDNITDESGNSIFVIDVHCTFLYDEKDKKKQITLQEQGGVIIYRFLLNKFKDCQDKLKVIFYSPTGAKNLVSFKPENYVLNLLPFIELYPKDVKGNYVENWSFETDLQTTIKDNKFSQFNNASENLLSGWALAGSKKINLRNKKPLIIDDEWREWSTTYKEILNQKAAYFLADVNDIKTEFKKLNSGNQFEHLPEGSLTSYDFIISDLYLWENHEIDTWKTKNFIDSISGFRLFKQIREIAPAIPIIFHTTSTKFRIFETLSALGSDGQISKNTKPDASSEEKEDNFRWLKAKLESITNPYSDCWLNEFYRFTSDHAALSNSWLNQLTGREYASAKREAIDVLRSLIYSAKYLRQYKPEYLDKFFMNNEIKPISLVVAAMVNSSGKIPEILDIQDSPELTLMIKLRNHASHGRYSKLFTLVDIFFILVLLEKNLQESTRRTISNNRFLSNEDFLDKKKFTHPLFEYTHYYNCWYDYIPPDLIRGFEFRIKSLFDDYYHNHWVKYKDKDVNGLLRSIPYLTSGSEAKVIFSNKSCVLRVEV